MADQAASPESDEPRGVSEWVELFAERLAEDPELDLDRFCGRCPKDLRLEIRERCDHVRGIGPALRREDPPRARPSAISMRRLGDFQPLRLIGEGGMSHVYLATQISMKRSVALKILKPHLTLSDRHIERFHNEASWTGLMAHPRIVDVITVDSDEGQHFIAMKYIAGRSLAAVLRDRRSEAELRQGAPLEQGSWWAPIPSTPATAVADAEIEPVRDKIVSRPATLGASYIAWVISVVADMADALECAHGLHIIHRDVKPHNILIDEDGNPNLVDFGLAKDVTQVSITDPGSLAGTLPYMSPEQALTKRVRIDHRTDVYSLGVVLYEMLTLRRPFGGTTSQKILWDISFTDPVPVRRINPRVPKDLAVLCHKAMEKSPENRFADAAEFCSELRRVLNHEAIQSRPPSPWRRVTGLVRRRQKTAVAVLAVLLTVIAATIWFTHRARQQAIADRLAPLTELAANESLAAVEFSRLLEGLQGIEGLRRDYEGSLDGDTTRQLNDLESRIRACGAERKKHGLEMLEQASSPLMETSNGAGDRPSALFASLRNLMEASVLLRDEELVRGIIKHGPKLKVETDEPDARVHYQPIDIVTGAPRTLTPIGKTPLSGVDVSPGYYRFVIRNEKGYAELSRYVSVRETPYLLRPRIRATNEVVKPMISIPRTRFAYGHPANPPPYNGRKVEVEAFWIDRCEVSNAEYRAFLADNPDASPPAFWNGKYSKEWDDLPVTGITMLEARAFAEWAGKRLPTIYEWELAARGAQSLEFPWGKSRGKHPIVWDIRTPGGKGKSKLQLYIARTAPVRESTERWLSPFGLHHTLDNVDEWTETIYVDGVLNSFVPLPSVFVRRGGSWASWTDPHLSCYTQDVMSVAHIFTGFRCAKSRLPQK